MTPLLGADGEVYAVAQGSVSSGGFVVKGQGASVTKGVPTSGRIPTGAIVEREVGFQLSQLHSVSLMLHNPDFTTARRIAQVINAHMKSDIAQPTDPSTVVLNVPPDLKGEIVDLMTDIEQLEIEPDQVARVVIDEQNGIIVMGENVRISTVAVAQGNLTVKITETPQVSQPNAFAPGGQPTTFNPLNASGFVKIRTRSSIRTQPPVPSGPGAHPNPGNSTLTQQPQIQPYSAPQSNNPALPGAPGNENVQFAPGGGASTVVVPRTNIQVDEQSDHRMAVVKQRRHLARAGQQSQLARRRSARHDLDPAGDQGRGRVASRYRDDVMSDPTALISSAISSLNTGAPAIGGNVDAARRAEDRPGFRGLFPLAILREHVLGRRYRSDVRRRPGRERLSLDDDPGIQQGRGPYPCDGHRRRSHARNPPHRKNISSTEIMPFPARNPLPSARGNNAAAAPSNIPVLCAVANELATLLDRETALIRAMKLKEIGPLQADKARLTKLCGTTLKTDRSGCARSPTRSRTNGAR